MTDFKKRSSESQTRDYRERFEFRLTVGENIICQRYFRINNFNPQSLMSFELADVMRSCAATIDEDLKMKTLAYLEIFAPMYFDNEEQMNTYFANPANAARMRPGYGIVVKGASKDYYWGKNDAPALLNFKFDDGELTAPLKDEDRVTYKFAFCVDGREVCSTVWEGVYPKYIRNSIDLSNRKGRRDDEDVSRLNFEQYLDYKVAQGHPDLVWILIQEICDACTGTKNAYTTKETYGDTVYNNVPDYSLWVNPDGTLKPFKKRK